jgi:hypothetical protein
LGLAKSRKRGGVEVSTIPTPFIGGADSPHTDEAAGQELQPPFYPEPEGEAAEATSGAASASLEPPALTEPALLEAEAATPIAETASDEEEIHVFIEEVSPEDEAPDAEKALPVEAAAAEGESLEAQEGEAEEAGIPEFLTGPDTPVPSTRIAGETVRLETPQRLAEAAQDLLQGDQGDWIRTLIADLGPHAPEIAVPRAFAAGYLAARAREES